MLEFTIKPIECESEEDYECPNPSEPSVILFEVEYVDGKDWGIYECQYEGGAAAYENEFGVGVIEVVKDFVDVSEVEEGEWYVIEGFTSHFTRDYYGEVDCHHYFDKFRRASIYDRLYFGV